MSYSGSVYKSPTIFWRKKVVLLPIAKVLGKMIKYKNIPKGKVMKGRWFQNLQFWLRNGQNCSSE